MTTTATADRAMICTADHRASSAGLAILRAGGSAVDAAVAAGAVLAVVAPQRCGMGGDLFALVHTDPGPPEVLNASGRTGSGADPDALREEGHRRMPVRHDIRSVPVPGCVDGWLALHGRHGRLPLAEVLQSAVLHAERGFAATPEFVAASEAAVGAPGTEGLAWARRPGDHVTRPGFARALRAIIGYGRAGFYQGEFGDGLLKTGRGLYTGPDLAESDAEWRPPLGLRAFGHDVWTAAPNSQGYVLLLGLALAEGLGLPGIPDDPAWAHLLAESALAAADDRTEVLHEHADGDALVDPERIVSLRAAIDPTRHWRRRGSIVPADTTCVCAVDERGMGVSLLQSNANGFGSLLFEPNTGINLHNRGIGFGLAPGQPNEYGPRRRPPHTLVPVLATRPDGTLRAVLGSTGGDLQPQVTLQLLVRMLRHATPADDALAAPRWRLATGLGLFETWQGRTPIRLDLEKGSPPAWTRDLPGYGHLVRAATEDDEFGEAQVIEAPPGGGLRGAAEPRSPYSAALGY
ncbi:gamma-glutamyltransferase [Actinomadura rubrisoli]|uniref:Gamma-glutamyltranspeptidase n=1 Tax=Actinomadura rubrisoli TaxID=2530368 RepID=A0A4R5BX38_9ACTN|nr:gamma-glutamyltransferase [Actinomadura rubrisoli]TDD90805.1 gamma-glutamyltranspeptidase [Actinomadura rubrisoli]